MPINLSYNRFLDAVVYLFLSQNRVKRSKLLSKIHFQLLVHLILLFAYFSICTVLHWLSGHRASSQTSKTSF